MDLNIQYYEKNSLRYIKDTVGINMHELYSEFEKKLKVGARILDLGCGSGRDSKYFSERGYDVVAVDPSVMMCKSVKRLVDIPIYNLAAQSIDFRNEFDGIWACASLLHIHYSELNCVIEKIQNALICGGIFYSSWKKGVGQRNEDDRIFFDMTKERLQTVMQNFPELQIIEIWETRGKKEGTKETIWINLLVKKR